MISCTINKQYQALKNIKESLTSPFDLIFNSIWIIHNFPKLHKTPEKLSSSIQRIRDKFLSLSHTCTHIDSFHSNFHSNRKKERICAQVERNRGTSLHLTKDSLGVDGERIERETIRRSLILAARVVGVVGGW